MLVTIPAASCYGLIGVARWRNQFSPVVNAFEDARNRRKKIEATTNRDTPVGDIFDRLIGFARQLRDDVQKFI